MQAHDIPHIVRHLLEKHSLLQEGWRFKWDHALRRCGCCRYHKKQITLSRSYVDLNIATNLDDIIDTILHEIAHALTGPGHGHDNAWKAMCVQVGAKPQRCADAKVIIATPKLVARCLSCGKEYARHRIGKNRSYYCPYCGPDRGKLVFAPRVPNKPVSVPVNPTEGVPPLPRKLRGI